MIRAVGWNAGWFTSGKTKRPIVDYQYNRKINNLRTLYSSDIADLAISGMLIKKDLFEEVEGFELAYCPYMAIMHLPHQTT